MAKPLMKQTAAIDHKHHDILKRESQSLSRFLLKKFLKSYCNFMHNAV